MTEVNAKEFLAMELANIAIADPEVPRNKEIMEGLPPSSEMVLDTEEGVEDMMISSTHTPDTNSADDGLSPPLATDHDAMREILFPPLPEDPKILDDVVDTWSITAWKSMSKKEHGPRFEAGGVPWRILLFPHGNNIDQTSIYLEHAFDPDDLPEGWSCCAHFALVLWNPKDPTVLCHHTATHRFTKEESDWGFTRFLELRKMFNVTLEGASRPICEDETANISAYVRVVQDETGVLWHNWVNYDSKKETGYVGLKNQGATCYLNSLLQSLYFTNAFRKAIYDIPTEDEDVTGNSAYTLQRLFYQLQTSPASVGTNELTKSFGWETRHVFEQQDVQELSRKLMERMEERMKGTPAEKVLPEMFSGKIKTYISCINVPYESSRVEDFWDIQLNVRGLPTLEASFEDYIQVERMDGENQYFASDEYRLQDAKKGVIFLSFPEVLHLQLKRFEYDVNRDMMTKINDRYEFPETFDAAPYLSEDADRSEPWEYQLHSVLIHQGDLTAGHYYAFIKPDKDGWFYRFDDEFASKATLRKVCDDGFGGVYKTAPGQVGKGAMQPRKAPAMRPNSAYMLVYIRKSRLDNVLRPVIEEDIPGHLTESFKQETRIKEERRKEREDAHLYTSVKLVTNETFKNHGGTELAPWDATPESCPAAPRVYKILKSSKFRELIEGVAEDLQVDPRLLRLWTMVNRQNKTVRPESPLLDLDLTVEVVFLRTTAIRDGTARLWAEVAATADAQGEPVWQAHQAGINNMVVADKLIVLFLKYFDVEAQQLRGVGHFYVDKEKRVEDILTVIKEIMGWRGDEKITLWEEIKPTMIEQLKLKQTLKAAELQDGDIICFQRSPERKSDRTSMGERLGLGEKDEKEKEDKDDKAKADVDRIETAKEYYDFLAHKVTVRFQAHPTKCDPSKYEPLEMELNPAKVGYDSLAERVGTRLDVPSTRIRFWTVNSATGNPKVSVKRNPLNPPLLASIIGVGQTNYQLSAGVARPDYLLFFEILDMNLSELELSKNVKAIWLSEGITKETLVDMFVPKNGIIADMIKVLVRKLSLPDEAEGGPIRIYEASQNRFFRELQPEWPVVNINEYSTLYAERIPEDEVGAEANQFIQCFNFSTEPSRTHGVPFRLLLKEEEPFSETKKRIEKRTGLKGKLFEKIQFGLVRRTSFSKPQYLKDDDQLWNLSSPSGDEWLGLDRPDRTRVLRNGVGDLFLK